MDLGRNIHLKTTGCSEEFLFTSTLHRRLGLSVAEACVSLLRDCIKCCSEPCLLFIFEEALQVRSASLKAINEKWVEGVVEHWSKCKNRPLRFINKIDSRHHSEP